MAETCWLSLYPHLCPLAARLWAVGMCHFTVIMLSLTQSDRAASTPAFSFSLQPGGEGRPSQEHFKPPLSSLTLSFLLIFKLICLSRCCLLGPSHWGPGPRHGPRTKPPNAFYSKCKHRAHYRSVFLWPCPPPPHLTLYSMSWSVNVAVPGSAGVTAHLLPSHI